MQLNQLKSGTGVYGSLSVMPGYEEYEYQLILAMPDAVKEKVRKAREVFQNSYPLPFGTNLPIILPLVKFRQKQLLEDRVRRNLYQLVSGWRPYQITLKDFASQPSHSIYIPVASRAGSSAATGLMSSVKELKTIQSLLRPDSAHQPYFPIEHKLLLANRLPSVVFDQAWKAYSQKSFTAQFLADACLLLKRKPGFPNWQIAQRFEMRNLPVGIRQASLFEA